MITLARLLEANGEEHRYAFIRNKHLVPLDPSLPEFPMADKIKGYTNQEGNSEKIWYVTKAPNRECWLVITSSYDNLEEFKKNHRFTLTMKNLENLISEEIESTTVLS